jgi:CheY-like chemotaxis protein
MIVLLVDDEPMMRKMMKSMLERRGVQVLDAGNAAEALAISREHAFDVLVTDIVMDGVDGWKLAESLIRERPALPVLFISGMPADFETEGRRYPRCAFLPKPFQANDLMNAIDAVFHSGK